MARVYITASNRWSALFFGGVLALNGHRITSKWHDQAMTPTKDIPEPDKFLITDRSVMAIKESDVLVVIADPDMVPGGKFVDVGVALGSGIPVILVGRRENLKMYNSNVTAVADHVELLKVFDEKFAV